METIQKNNLKELESQQKDFTEQVKKQKALRYGKIVNYNCYGISIFSFLVFLLTFVSFLFIGTSKVYNANFSFVGIYWWLESLPNVVISQPAAQMAQFVIGVIFLPFYLGIFIRLIVVLVKLIKRLISLSDIAVNEMNPVNLALEITRLTVASVGIVMLFVIATQSTTSARLPDVTIACIVFFAFLIIAETAMKILYVYYDVETATFNSKEAILYSVYKFVLLFLPLLMFLLLNSPQLKSFAGYIQAYKSYGGSVGATSFVYMFILPILQFFFGLTVFGLFINVLKYGGYDLCVNSVSFYDRSLTANADNQILKDSVKTFTNWLIFFAIVLFAVEAIFVLVQVGFSNVNVYLPIALRFLFNILMCVAIKKASKVKIKYPAKLLH